MMAGSVMAASTTGVTVDLWVTPVVIVDLAISPTYYYFGSVDLGKSTNSATGLNVQVGDEGTVGIKLEKAVWGDDGWDVTLSSGVEDGFELWSMTKATEATRPALADYTNVNGHDYDESALYTFNNLTVHDAATQTVLTTTEEVNLWFKLDMPEKISVQGEQTLQVRIRASAN